MKYQVEYTDTFGGEANYCWVRRAEIESSDQLGVRKRSQIVRQAKKAVGITGLRGRTYDHGELIEFRPYRMCTVMFITPVY